MNMVDALDRARRFFPDREAVIDGDVRLTYEGLAQEVGRAACGLRSLGIDRGDRVCLFLNNRAEFLIALYATMKLGAVCVSLSPMLKADEATGLLNDCGAAVLITEAGLMGNVPAAARVPSVRSVVGLDGAPCETTWDSLLGDASATCDTVYLNPDDPATMIYTSGTTGQSKGVVLTHGNLVSNTCAAKYMCGMQGEDRSICFLPMSHSFAQNFITNATIQAASTLVVMKGFQPDEALRLIAEEKVTRFYAVPPIYIMLLAREDAAQAMASVTYCFSAASSMPEEIARRWKEQFGLKMHEAYGLTETSPFATYNHELRHKPGSVGTPIMNVEVRVVDPVGHPVPTGQACEIQVRGPNVIAGYFGKPEETAEAMIDGWLRTGDVGYLDDEGYLFLVDRLKDMINNAGLKVWPRQVEEVLYCHPMVRECAVIGVPHEVFGETVKAVIVLATPGGADADEIRRWVAERLSDYKVPRIVEFVEELPKNATGKILKRELRPPQARTAG